MHTVEPDSVRLRAVLVVVRQGTGLAAAVPFLAAHRARMTADASVEVDDQSELSGSRERLGQHGHQPTSDDCLHRTGFAPSRGATSGSALGPQGSIDTVTSNQA